MSGNWATGIRVSARMPPIVITTAITTASRGRSTKIAEIIGSLLVVRRIVGRWVGTTFSAAWPNAIEWAVGRRTADTTPRNLRLDRRQRARGLRRHRFAGADSLQPFADDELSFLEPICHHGHSGGRLAELDASLLRLVLRVDHKDV